MTDKEIIFKLAGWLQEARGYIIGSHYLFMKENSLAGRTIVSNKRLGCYPDFVNDPEMLALLEKIVANYKEEVADNSGEKI